jgi:phosphoserine phosphatase RsbU/P
MDQRASPPRLGWRYALVTILTLIVTSQLVGSLWTLSKFARAAGATYFGFGADYSGMSISDLQEIRHQSGIVVTDVDTLSPPQVAGLQVGDVIIAVNGVTLTEHPDAMVRAKMHARAGDTLTLKWQRGAEEHEASMAVPSAVGKGGHIVAGESDIRMSAGTLLRVVYGPEVLLAVPFLFTGALIGFLKPGVSVAFRTAALFLFIGVYCFPEDLPGIAIWPSWILGLSVAVERLSGLVSLPLFLSVMAVFPNPSRLGAKVLKREWIIILLLGLVAPGILLSGLSPICDWAARLGSRLPWFNHVVALESIMLVTLGVVGLVLWIAQRFEARGRPQTKQRLLNLGLLAAIVGMIWQVFPLTVLIGMIFHPRGSVLPMALFILEVSGWILLIAFLPISFAYAVLAHRVFGIRFIIRKGLQHLLVSKGALLIGWLLVFVVVQQVLSRSSQWTGSVTATSAMAVAAAFVGSVGLRRVNVRLMRTIDRRFFREALDVRHMLSQLSEELADLRDEEKIYRTVGGDVLKALHPSRVVLLSRKQDAGDLECVLTLDSDQRRQGATDTTQLPPLSETPVCLKSDDAVIKKLECDHWLAIAPETLDPQVEEEARLLRTGCELLIAIPASTGLLGVMGLGAKLSEEAYTGEDRELLLTVAQQTGMALENAALVEVAKLEAEHAKELEIARGVQQNLFPKELPPREGWQFAAMCRPARAVGGDYYDLFEIDATHVGLALGDVSGKGLGPALMMSSIHAITRNSMAQIADKPSRFVESLNEHLVNSTSAGMFATFFVGVLDTSTGTLCYVNAGHNPPIVVAGASSDVSTLTDGGLIVGALRGAKYTDAKIHMGDGDLLVIYSDGITEAMNPEGEMFDEERLLATIRNARTCTQASEVLSSIIGAVDRFVGDAEQADDMSVVIVRRDTAGCRS